MTADRDLTPDDAVVAIRSFPRRFRAVLAAPADEHDRFDPDEVGRRVGPGGRSAADHLLAADGVLALLGEAVQQTRGEDDPVLHPAFADLATATTADESAADAHTPIGDLLDRFEATAAYTADRVDGVPSDDWGRQVRVAGLDAGRRFLDLAQDAVGVVADHLRAAQRTIDAVV
jgi:hypothetical protein